MSKWFYDTSTDTTRRIDCCGSLLVGLSSLEFELWRRHGGHEDLRGSGRQSVIPYVYGESYCITVCVLFKLGVQPVGTCRVGP
jgi:hypothetical protein